MAHATWPRSLRIDVRAHLSGKGAGDDRNAPQAAERLVERAADFATYAILSNNAYQREKPFPLPPGWSEAKDKRFDEGEGLAYAVYERRTGDKVAAAVVAFRGTDDLKDWLQNVTPFHKQTPDAERAFKVIADHYRGLGADTSATGHSLGGGLALHMAFTFPRVEAIAFNSSPVVQAGKDPFMGNRRTSVWEAGEVLQPLRELKGRLRHFWTGTELVEVDFDKNDSPLKQHEMEPLAYNLVRLAALYSEPFQQILRELPGQTGAR
jgi:hypothetical protein